MLSSGLKLPLGSLGMKTEGWHYQLLKHEEPGGEEWYGIHEVYSVGLCTKDPIQIVGDSLKDIVWTLRAIESDMKRYGIGNYNDFK